MEIIRVTKQTPEQTSGITRNEFLAIRVLFVVVRVSKNIQITFEFAS